MSDKDESKYTIINLTSNKDIFDEDIEDDNKVNFANKIHVRIQQRTGKKSICLIQGLSTELDLKKILKTWKKTMKCNGTILDDESGDKIIQLQGDQRKAVKDFLLEQQICVPEDLIIHGF
jgi:translation initiation factor 1